MICVVPCPQLDKCRPSYRMPRAHMEVPSSHTCQRRNFPASLEYPNTDTIEWGPHQPRKVELPPQGSAFLASICHLLSITYLCRDDPLKVCHLSERMKTAPLASFKNLQTIILPYPYTTTPISLNPLGNQGIDVHMQLLTLPATLLKHSDNINGGIPNAIRAFDDIIHPGREATLSDSTRYRCLVLKYVGILVWGRREFGPGCYEVGWECYCTYWRVRFFLGIRCTFLRFQLCFVHRPSVPLDKAQV
jgi:hypothetical protein